MNKLLTAVAIVALVPLFLASGAAQAASSYTPELVKAFSTTSDTDYAVNYISSFGSKVAVELANRDVWISDGTTSGTTELTATLTAAGLTDWGIRRSLVQADSVDINGELYFFGYTDVWDIWKTNGTTVSRVSTGLISSGYEHGTMHYVGGMLYVIQMGGGDYGLFQIDPASGTIVTVDDEPQDDTRFDGVTQVQLVGGLIVFQTDQGVERGILATWDPASPGTPPVDIMPSSGGLGNDATDDNYLSPTFDSWTMFNGEMYFSANGNDGSSSVGLELFKTDGTQAGTVLVKDLTNDVADSDAMHDGYVMPTIYNGELYFSGHTAPPQQLWKTDGTTAGTVIAVDTVWDPGSYTEGAAVEINGKLILDFFASETGQEFYVTDGTNAGTYLLADINASGDSACWDTCTYTALFDNHVFFVAYDGTTNAVWETDGTPAGTSRVTTFAYDGAIGTWDDASLVVAGDSLFFGVANENLLLADAGTGEMALYKISKPSLPDTGIDAGGLGIIIALLIAAGLGAIVVARRTNVLGKV